MIRQAPSGFTSKPDERSKRDLVAGDANQQEHSEAHGQAQHGQSAIPNFGLGSKSTTPGIELARGHLIRSSIQAWIDLQIDLLNVLLNAHLQVLWIDPMIELGHRGKPMPYPATLEGLKASLGFIETAGVLQRQPGGHSQLHGALQSS